MKLIQPSEILIEGKWLSGGTTVSEDTNCHRINWLISNCLKEVGVDGSGWEKLYLDLSDGRLWVLCYPNSEMHGGGPPTLMVVEESKAKERFRAI